MSAAISRFGSRRNRRLETIQQTVIHRFDVFRKQAHDALRLVV
jgi:hypothetical protein